jgi:hypothetical protein
MFQLLHLLHRLLWVLFCGMLTPRCHKLPWLCCRLKSPVLPRVSGLARLRVSQATPHPHLVVVRWPSLPLPPRRIHLPGSRFGRAACWTGAADSPRLRVATYPAPSPQDLFHTSTRVLFQPPPHRFKSRKQLQTCSAKRLGLKRPRPERWVRVWDRWGRGAGCYPRCWSHRCRLVPHLRLLSTRRSWASA